MPSYLDIFAGAGGLSEGFLRAGFSPIAHIEMDTAACYTLKTRSAYKWLSQHGDTDTYKDYLAGKISRETFYQTVPRTVLDHVLNFTISENTLPEIFKYVDASLGKEQLDLIIGGPPCQAYSIAGRARDKNAMLGDPRNYLYKLYAEFLRRYTPKYFVFENVVGLLSARDHDGELYLTKMIRLFKECGYSVEYKVLNAHNFGVLQNRERVILIGKYGAHQNFYPEIKQPKNSSLTVEEIFKDLPRLHAGEGSPYLIKTKKYNGEYLYTAGIKNSESDYVTLHYARPQNNRDLQIYKLAVHLWNSKMQRLKYSDLPSNLKTQRNTTSFLDRYKVVAANLPYSQTVVAHLSKDGHYFIHPDIKQNRSITPREAARLQTFPDDYYFESSTGKPSRAAAFKQIGNAVPVLLAEHIAKALLANW